MVKLSGQPLNINLIQTYAPTADKTDEEVMNFYGNIKHALMMTNENHINIIMGDFNANVGKRRCGDTVGDLVLGNLKERFEILI